MEQPEEKCEHLRVLVERKNGGYRALSDAERRLGFLGWHQRGYLPHCDCRGLTQFVTFRLADSLPASRGGEWELLLELEEGRERRTQLEAYLDRGHGACQLADPRVASLMESSLLFWHEKRCEVLAWCVMPNHVHVLVLIGDTPLGKLVRSWKRFVQTWARTMDGDQGQASRRLDGRGFDAERRLNVTWQREYWDTYMRDRTQVVRAVRYIERNPVKCRLCREAERWPFSSARFRDCRGQLVLPTRLWSGPGPSAGPADCR